MHDSFKAILIVVFYSYRIIQADITSSTSATNLRTRFCYEDSQIYSSYQYCILIY